MKFFSIIKNKSYSWYLEVVSSIAFYPSIIAVALFFLSFILLTVEDQATTKFFVDHVGFLVINNAGTARTILGTLIGGIISLTVFSFSMVMVLLNQASNSFSPRLLPGLVSDKRNQVVLGLYLGTIIYNIIVLISILPDGNEYTLKGLSVLVGIVLGIICLAMFVFFIHSISTNIQINNVIDNIFDKTKNRLHYLLEKEREKLDPIEFDANAFIIKNKKVGYYQGVNLDGLIQFCEEHEVDVKIIPYKGKYLLPGEEIIKYNKELDEEKQSLLMDLFLYTNRQDITENYVLGVKQITEVGVKAMSPGINDPGTAVMTIDYLTELFAMRMKIEDTELYATKSGKIVELNIINFQEVIYHALAAYRQYCKHDIVLMEKILSMLTYLKSQPSCKDVYKDIIETQLKILAFDVDTNIENRYDRELLRDRFALSNELASDDYTRTDHLVS